MAEVCVVDASSELGAGTRGASLGYSALKVAAWKNGSQFIGMVPEEVVPNENHALFSSDHTPFGHRIQHLVSFEQKLSVCVSNQLKNNKITVVVGGDHSIAIGSVSGSKSANTNQRLGVVWVDAHADLHSPFSTPSGNVHGMPLAALLDMDNQDLQRNQPVPATSAAWEQLQSIGCAGPKLNGKDLVFIALRDTEKEEDAIIERLGIKVIRVADIRGAGASQAVADTLAHLEGCDRLHISFDVDSLDTSISRGTGTPVDDGLFLDEAETILTGLMRDPRSSTLDVVEINPTLDEENKMAEAVLPILDKVYHAIQDR